MRIKPVILILSAIASAVIFIAVDLYAASLCALDGPPLMNLERALTGLMPMLLRGEMNPATPIALVIALAASCTPWLIWAYSLTRATDRKGEEHGSARWATTKELQGFADRRAGHADNNLILSKSARMALSREKFDLVHDRNKNVLVIGVPGSGKTRYYVKPNLMQLNADFFVTDPKATLIRETGSMFADAGYRVVAFDTTDFSRSMRYNPLAYVKTQADILSLVNCIIKNTTAEDAKSNDPFWENSEKLLYTALIAYLIDHCPKKDQTVNGLLLLLSLAEAREADEGYLSPLDVLFEELETGRRMVGAAPAEAEKPRRGRGFAGEASSVSWVQVEEPVRPEEDFALANYKAFKTATGKTLKSIIISCNVRLKPLSINGVAKLLSDDEMKLDTLGDPKHPCIIFAAMSDTDSTFDFLFSMLMWQTMNVLCRRAIEDFSGALPRPVHFILDEFANLGTVPDFTRMIATIRSRNIFCSVIVQSLSQLEKGYEKEGAATIIDCCDTTVFLGGKSSETNEMIAKMAGKQTIRTFSENDSRGTNSSYSRYYQLSERDLITPDEVGRLKREDSIVLISGIHPYRDEKFVLEGHPRYKLIDPGHAGAVHQKPFDITAYRKNEEVSA